jgi:N-acetylneuraminic acid mutarotase
MNRRPRRVIALTVVGILMAGLAAGGGWWLGQRGDRQPAAAGVTTAPPTSPPATATTAPATPTSRARVGTWQRLPAAPIPAGSDEFSGVWTGRELLLYGAVHDPVQRPRAAGAAYNPATNTWRRLPPAPGPVENAEGGYTAVWTGTELIVAGGTGSDAHGNVVGYETLADAAAYNPTIDTWRRLPPMPEPRTNATATWTATEVPVVGGRDAGRHYADGVAYNPATNRWRRLPAMESNRIGHTATRTASQLLIWGGQTRRGGSWTAPTHGLAYDPASNRWVGAAQVAAAWPDRPRRGMDRHADADLGRPSSQGDRPPEHLHRWSRLHAPPAVPAPGRPSAFV